MKEKSFLCVENFSDLSFMENFLDQEKPLSSRKKNRSKFFVNKYIFLNFEQKLNLLSFLC